MPIVARCTCGQQFGVSTLQAARSVCPSYGRLVSAASSRGSVPSRDGSRRSTSHHIPLPPCSSRPDRVMLEAGRQASGRATRPRWTVRSGAARSPRPDPGLPAQVRDRFRRLGDPPGRRASRDRRGRSSRRCRRMLYRHPSPWGSGRLVGKALPDAGTARPLPRGFGRYRPLEQLGSGGMGTVCRGSRSDAREDGGPQYPTPQDPGRSSAYGAVPARGPRCRTAGPSRTDLGDGPRTGSDRI